jgi:probable phosphomutase (TIGR03848 family)
LGVLVGLGVGGGGLPPGGWLVALGFALGLVVAFGGLGFGFGFGFELGLVVADGDAVGLGVTVGVGVSVGVAGTAAAAGSPVGSVAGAAGSAGSTRRAAVATAAHDSARARAGRLIPDVLPLTAGWSPTCPTRPRVPPGAGWTATSRANQTAGEAASVVRSVVGRSTDRAYARGQAARRVVRRLGRVATVVLVRHGRTAASTAGVLAGWTPAVPLDEAGRAQVRALAERLRAVPLAAVVTSPLDRCRETAAALVAGRDLVAQLDDGLAECRYGDWTGKSIKELARLPLWRVVQDQPSAARFPGGESLGEVQARAVQAVRRHDEAVTREQGEHAVWLAVSHGDVIKAVLADALGTHLDQFQRIVVDPGSISVVRYTPRRPFVLRVNDTGGDLAALLPARRRRRARGAPSGDADVGGGSGAT